jgi:hypothetical protein
MGKESRDFDPEFSTYEAQILTISHRILLILWYMLCHLDRSFSAISTAETRKARSLDGLCGQVCKDVLSALTSPTSGGRSVG